MRRTLASSPKNRNLYPTSINNKVSGYCFLSSTNCFSRGVNLVVLSAFAFVLVGAAFFPPFAAYFPRNALAAGTSTSSSSSSGCPSSSSTSTGVPFDDDLRIDAILSGLPNFATNFSCRDFFLASCSGVKFSSSLPGEVLRYLYRAVRGDSGGGRNSLTLGLINAVNALVSRVGVAPN